MRIVQVDNEVERVLHELASAQHRSENEVLRELVGLGAHDEALGASSASSRVDVDPERSRLRGVPGPTAYAVRYVSEWGP